MSYEGYGIRARTDLSRQSLRDQPTGPLTQQDILDVVQLLATEITKAEQHGRTTITISTRGAKRIVDALCSEEQVQAGGQR